MPLRCSLSSFARHVDTEAVLQEALLRIWQVAPTVVPDGKPNALLRLGSRIARNLAITEIRRTQPQSVEPWMLEETNEPRLVEPATMDAEFREVIERCFEKLPPKPKQAMQIRLASDANVSDEVTARSMGMKFNTFVQNIRRARLAIKDCLAKHGITVGWNQ